MSLLLVLVRRPGRRRQRSLVPAIILLLGQRIHHGVSLLEEVVGVHRGRLAPLLRLLEGQFRVLQAHGRFDGSEHRAKKRQQEPQDFVGNLLVRFTLQTKTKVAEVETIRVALVD